MIKALNPDSFIKRKFQIINTIKNWNALNLSDEKTCAHIFEETGEREKKKPTKYFSGKKAKGSQIYL